jgi:hypothetical protein
MTAMMERASFPTDERIPVRFGPLAAAEPHDALLIEGDAQAAGAAVARFVMPARLGGHPVGCACCAPRGPVATALGALFLARARGELKWFRSVVAVTRSAAGEAAVRAALVDDVVTAARFREERG